MPTASGDPGDCRTGITCREGKNSRGPQYVAGTTELSLGVDRMLDVVPHRDCVELRISEVCPEEWCRPDRQRPVSSVVGHRLGDVDACNGPPATTGLVEEEAGGAAHVQWVA